MTRKTAIRKKCLDCCSNSHLEVTLCPIPDCALWTFRTGNEPNSPTYKKRLKTALDKHKHMYKYYKECGIDIRAHLRIPVSAQTSEGFRGSKLKSTVNA
jgi:hypothetical protein